MVQAGWTFTHISICEAGVQYRLHRSLIQGSDAHVLVGAAADLQRADLLLHSTAEPPPLGPPYVKNCLDA